MFIFFQICFFIGIILSLLIAILGKITYGLGFYNNYLKLTPFRRSIVLPISPIIFIIFTTVFGGVGWIIHGSYSWLSILIQLFVATLAGVFISASIYYIVIKPINKAHNTYTPLAEELVGVRATVIESIAAGGFGIIRYAINGSIFNSPSKATNGSIIQEGKNVVICWIEESIFMLLVLTIGNLVHITDAI